MRALGFVVLLAMLLPVGCSGQNRDQSAAVNRRIENTVRNITEVPPSVEITVGQRTPSEDPNWDKVPVTFKGTRGTQTIDFLLSKDEKKLARLNTFDLASDPMEKIDLKGRPVRGNQDAKVTIVNYDDYQCPYCARMHKVITDDILKTYGDKVKIVYKDFPLLSIHPWAKRAALTANCLAAQNGEAFWAFADEVHGSPGKVNEGGTPTLALTKIALGIADRYKLDAKKLDACLKSEDDAQLRASMQEAEGLHVQATPTLFINGERLEGALPPSELRAAIDRALRHAGETPPAAANSQGTAQR